MERSGSTSEMHVQCRTLWSVVNCWIRYNDLCCKLCNISVYQAFMYFMGHYISAEREKETKPSTHHIKYNFCPMTPRDGHLLLRGNWNVFKKYIFWPCHEQKWNKYPVTHRNKRKYSIYRPLDNKWQIYLQNVARKHQNHGGLIQNFCVNKFGVLPLCYPC
jgi:hypothetical protein